jgi:organic hydroperoxide reductase OsmC/OhrA
MAEVESVRVTVKRQEGYRFEVDWGVPSAGKGVIDEPAPLSQGAGPNASRLVATAVAHCLSSSLLFCLSKSRVALDSLSATAMAEIQRNERGRWRLAKITVKLDPALPAEARAAFERCKGLFEDFCIVTESIRHGVPVDVTWA